MEAAQQREAPFRAQIDAIFKAAEELRAAQRESVMGEQTPRILNAVKALHEAETQFHEALAEAARRRKEAEKPAGRPAATRESAAGVVTDLSDAQREAMALSLRLRTEMELLRDTQSKNFALLSAGLITQETYNRSIVEATEFARKFADEQEEVAVTTSALTEELEFMALRGIDAFADFAVGAGGSIHDFVQRAMQDLGRLLARFLVINALKKIFAGATGGFGGFILAAPRAGRPGARCKAAGLSRRRARAGSCSCRRVRAPSSRMPAVPRSWPRCPRCSGR